MKALLLLLLSIPSFACGTQRWGIKTLQSGLYPSRVQETSVEQLTWLKAPSHQQIVRAKTSRFPDEEYRYEVTAYLMGLKLERDGDYHLVLADEDTPAITLIAEIPKPDCVPAKFKAFVTDMRKWIDAAIGKPTARYRTIKPFKLEVMGVGFFDYEHGQKGSAPNGFELHPVMGMCSELVLYPSCVGQDQP